MEQGPSIEPEMQRRVKVDPLETRFDLHNSLRNYFPDQQVINELQNTLNELEDNKFKGLREESCRFKLLAINNEVEKQLAWNLNYLKSREIKPNRVKPELVATASEDVLDVHFLKKSEVDTNLFERIIRNAELPADFLDSKKWDDERKIKFAARVASILFTANKDVYPDKIPAGVIKYLADVTVTKVDDIDLDREKIAREYLLSQISKDNLVKVSSTDDHFVQTEEDKRRLETIKGLSEIELRTKVMSTVRKNTENVRNTVVPRLLNNKLDSQSAFWQIHEGEFLNNPLEAQMVVGGLKAEVFRYIEQKAGSDFYDKSIGKLRANNVITGGFSHVETKYLPELQAKLFAKIDSIDQFKTEQEFLDFITQVDVVMYSLHLPFDGSGRAIEDFCYYLGEKFGYPVTFTALGYREPGSPILRGKENVAKVLKRQINSAALKQLGVESDPVGDEEALNLLCIKFKCSTQEATIALNAEKALFTANVIDSLGKPNSQQELTQKMSTVNELKKLWTQARTLKYINIPTELQPEFDNVVARMGVLQKEKGDFKAVYEILDNLKNSSSLDAVNAAKILEAYFLYTVGNFEGRNPANLYFEVFPDTESVYQSAAQNGSGPDQLRASMKVKSLRRSAEDRS